MPQLPIVGGAYQSNHKSIAAQEAVNCYAEVAQDAANQTAMVGVHGYTQYVDLGAAIRGLHNAWGRLFAVAGDTVYEVALGTGTALGTVSNDGLKASMSNNIFELMVLSAGRGWVVQKADASFAEVNDPDLPLVSVVDFLDGYGMLLEKDSGRFYFTTINDFETLSGTDFATAEGATDDTVSLVVDHRELWLFGEESIEVWDSVGDATNPFQRRPGAFIERGCRGTYSPAKMDNTLFWLGDNNVVYRADGITPIRVSNHGIENLIGKTTVDPIGFAYTWGGHDFYQLNFANELSCVYDASTTLWHTRKQLNNLDAGYEHYVKIGTTHYVGGADGKIYSLSDDVYRRGTESIPRVRAIGPLRTNGFTTMSELTFLFETGENADAANESKVFLEISDDQGRTFGSRIEGSVGKMGEYSLEVKFHALGGFYDNERVLKVSMTDNAKFALVGASYEP